jgi:hypothetical protein
MTVEIKCVRGARMHLSSVSSIEACATAVIQPTAPLRFLSDAVTLLHDIGTAADEAAMICADDDCKILRFQGRSQRTHILAHSHFVLNQTLSGTKCQKKSEDVAARSSGPCTSSSLLGYVPEP